MGKIFIEKHPIQKLMEKVKRGVAPIEHDNEVERAFIVSYLNGDEKAGMELVHRYLDFFSVIMNRPTKPPNKTRAMERLWVDPSYEDNQDLFQEVLYQFFLLVEEYDSESGDFSKMISSKLHQRVFNRYFSEYLVTQKMETELDEEVDLESPSRDIINNAERIPDQHIELYSALNKLSKRQREVIEMSVMKGWNSAVIAEEMGMSGHTVRVHLKRGLDKLKTIMGAE